MPERMPNFFSIHARQIVGLKCHGGDRLKQGIFSRMHFLGKLVETCWKRSIWQFLEKNDDQEKLKQLSSYTREGRTPACPREIVQLQLNIFTGSENSWQSLFLSWLGLNPGFLRPFPTVWDGALAVAALCPKTNATGISSSTRLWSPNCGGLWRPTLTASCSWWPQELFGGSGGLSVYIYNHPFHVHPCTMSFAKVASRPKKKLWQTGTISLNPELGYTKPKLIRWHLEQNIVLAGNTLELVHLHWNLHCPTNGILLKPAGVLKLSLVKSGKSYSSCIPNLNL